jgi:CubicO group peptidase (beta-lactamase class C family)
MVGAASVNGFCEDRFAAVRREFEKNFAERGEIGASVAIAIDGRPVVDLWGGFADQSRQQPWTERTMVVVFSATKGLAATCIHMLIDRGLLDVDKPVAHYWPQFAANGKGDVTVGMVLGHQAGLPVWQAEVPDGGLLDWDWATQTLAKERPLWEPGTCHGYHAQTIGYLEGELVRRITGLSIGQFLQREIAGPLGADAWIGLPKSEEGRVAHVYMAPPDPNSAMFAKFQAEPDWMGSKMLTNVGGSMSEASVNSHAFHAAELPAVGGICNARGLARIYSALALDGAVDGVRIVRPERLPGMRTVLSASSCDLILRVRTTFTLGYSKSWGDRRLGPGNYAVIGEQAFGTPGAGGSIGFADGQARMSFGYTMNRHGGGVGLNERGQSLIDAAYKTIGFRTSAPGFWVN